MYGKEKIMNIKYLILSKKKYEYQILDFRGRKFWVEEKISVGIYELFVIKIWIWLFISCRKLR